MRRVSPPPRTKEVQLGTLSVNEQRRLDELAEIRKLIVGWAKRRRLWRDAAIHLPFEYNDEIPRRGNAFLLTFEGPLYDVFNNKHKRSAEYYKQFNTLLEERGFRFDIESHVSVSIFPKDEKFRDELLTLYRWQWIQRLASERLYDLHRETYEYFAHNPDHLKRLEWRQYEELLDSIFRNQGFRTELGPGTNDGGVDIRLYQSQSIPALVTLVQAKRYTKKPIGLDAVAALFGNAVQQGASRGILATTSRFQPKAKWFAAAVQGEIGFPSIELVDSARIGGWCADIANELSSFFKSGKVPVPAVIEPGVASELTGKIVMASGGYNITRNYFAKIVADFKYEVILQPIGHRIVKGDIQVGEEVPHDDGKPGPRFVAFKRRYERPDGLFFWGGRNLYSLWDGKPQHFNWMD
jgi:Restriction endonuclease